MLNHVRTLLVFFAGRYDYLACYGKPEDGACHGEFKGL